MLSGEFAQILGIGRRSRLPPVRDGERSQPSRRPSQSRACLTNPALTNCLPRIPYAEWINVTRCGNALGAQGKVTPSKTKDAHGQPI